MVSDNQHIGRHAFEQRLRRSAIVGLAAGQV